MIHLLKSLDTNDNLRINFYDETEMIAKTWQHATEQIIKNYFEHAWAGSEDFDEHEELPLSQWIAKTMILKIMTILRQVLSKLLRP